MKILELFSGYGTATFALKALGIEHEVIGYSDIDKYANQCFQQNHCQEDNENKLQLGDCTKIDPNDLEDFDLLTGGFPCQAFSVAGKGFGEFDTRGTLFNEIIRIAEVKKPRYMLLENVKGLMSKKHKPTFNKIISELYRIGYFVKWQVLNTKEHGIPQNRERVFFTCFRNWNDFCNFKFPEKEELKIFLKDILEEKVDKKYHLKQEQVNKLITINNNGEIIKNIPQITQAKRIYSENGISPLLNIDWNPKVGINKKFLSIKNATKKGYLEGYPNDGVNLEQPNSKTRRGRIQKDVMGTLQTNDQRGVITKNFTIRKLTPKECFRLQGFLNDEVNLDGLSNTQRCKLAGNGQSVNVVKKIFKEMFN